MIQLYIVKEDISRQYLELPKDVQFQLEALNPAFDRELEQGDFSLPIIVEWTETNRKILGNPERLEQALEQGEVYWECGLVADGVPIYTKAKLTLLSVEGSFDYKNGQYELVITGHESFFGSQIRGVYLTNLHYGGAINYDSDTRTFAENVMKGLHPAVSQVLSFAPVFNSQFIDSSRADYDGEELWADTLNYVFKIPSSAIYTFNTPSAADPTIFALPGDANYIKYRTVPYFKLNFILVEIFKAFGYKLEGEFFREQKFANIHIDNNQALENYKLKTSDEARTIYPRLHVPEVEVAEFLQSFLLTFNLKMTFRGNVVSIDFVKKPSGKSCIDLTDFVINQYKSEACEEAREGIRLAYDFPSEDQAVSDFIKDIDKTRVRGHFASYSAAASFSFSPAIKNGELVFCYDTNYWFEWSTAANKFIFYSEGFQPREYGEKGITYEPKFTPLLQAVGVDEFDNIYWLNILASQVPGSYFNFRKQWVKNEFPMRFFYIGKRDEGAYLNVPYSSNTQGGFSLSYSAENSVYTLCWKAWINYLLKARAVTVSAYLPAHITNAELFENGIKIMSYQFMVRKINRTYGTKSLSELELLRI